MCTSSHRETHQTICWQFTWKGGSITWREVHISVSQSSNRRHNLALAIERRLCITPLWSNSCKYITEGDKVEDSWRETNRKDIKTVRSGLWYLHVRLPNYLPTSILSNIIIQQLHPGQSKAKPGLVSCILETCHRVFQWALVPFYQYRCYPVFSSPL